MDSKKIDSIVIQYTIKFPGIWEMKDFTTYEFFKPYTFSELGLDFQQPKIILNDILDQSIEPVFENKIRPDTANIILDMLFGLYFIHLDDFDFEPYFDYFNDFAWPYFYFNNFMHQIGIYTELIKQDIYQIKRNISTYINCYFSDDNKIYNTINYLNHNNGSESQVHNKNDIKNSFQFYLINNKIIKDNIINYEIDLNKIEKLIQLLKKSKTRDYVATEGCFCFAKSKKQYYFSLSGTLDTYNELGIEIESYLKNYFKHSSITYCPLNDDTLSFFIRNKNKQFLFKEPPRNYGVEKNLLPHNELSDLYKCCERKIFGTLKNNDELTIICKYNPCFLCIPAVRHEKNKRCQFTFYSFAENFNSFTRYLNKNKKKLIHKLELNIMNII